MDFGELIKRNDLSKSCRACLGISENMILLVGSDKTSIFDMFGTVTDLQLDMSDSLPKYLCDDCGKALETSYKFRQVCHQTNSLLVGYLAVKCEEKDFVVSDPMVDTLPDHNSDEEQLSSLAPNRGTLEQFPYAAVAEVLAEVHNKTENSLECLHCGFSASSLRALSIHMTLVHRKLKCRWCPDCNVTCDDLKKHKKTMHSQPLCCKLCNKSFKVMGHLTEHLRRHGGMKPHVCDVCNKAFATARHLRVHYRIHTQENRYKCQMCDLGFVHYGSLLSHLKRFHNQPSNNGLKADSPNLNHNRLNKQNSTHNFCGTCNRRVRSLSDHLQKIHGESCRPEDITKLCMVCGKQLGSNLKLKVHMRSHTGEAPYKCSYCELRMTTRSKMVVHERTHTGEKPYVCRVCGKAFAQSSVLKIHSWLHLERPEVCKICDQRFCRPTELKLHMRKHTGEKPFCCLVCSQTFKQRSHLVGHERTHSDFRPYQCHQCDKGFKQASTLKSHLRIHSGEKPHKCDRCDYACRQRFSLAQHVRRQHNDEPVAV